MEKLTVEKLLAELAKIDPAKRLRWLDASSVLRSVGTSDAGRAWFKWSTPLGVTPQIIALWKQLAPPPCDDPVAALRAIAARRGHR